ncbi:MAG: FAD-dependent monooxygenase [Polyangiales bacterium]
MKRVLVTGASITGPAVAWWLARYGMQVTVVERSQGVRDGGQTVDIRGASKGVVQRMQLEEAIRARTTHEKAIAFVDDANAVRAQFDAAAFDGEGPVAALEILRGELAKVLVEASTDKVDYVYGDQVTEVHDGEDALRVRFQSGKTAEFDLMIVAEGIGSATRQLVWGAEVTRRPFNLYTAYFTIPCGRGDGDVARWFNAPGGRGVFIRPDNLGTTRAVLNLISEPNGLESKSSDEQKRVMHAKFGDLGWEVPRVLEGMALSDDFYLEAVGQVRMPRWSKGRVAIVGDAAYCASPLSGMGTALALVGAYVLAGELATRPTHQDAFAAYERIVRPYVEKAQNLPSFIARIGQPQTRLGIALQRVVLAIGSHPKLDWLTGKLFSPPADNITLPDYRPATT